MSKPRSFMPHVNGMRALAILGILFYHLNSGYCPAGYFGVDVFLVISGYFLMASMMKAEKSSDIHYFSFLLKKAWRIIPSWLLVSCVFCLLASIFMVSMDGANSYLTACASSAFLADYLIDFRYDYFNRSAHENLFLHYWYLSITVQMYIIIPLLILVSLKVFNKKTTLILLSLLACLSLCFYWLTTSPHVPEQTRTALLNAAGMRSTYYHLLPRLWEILAGGAILLLPAWQEKHRLRLALACLGALAIIASFFCYTTGSPLVYLTVFSSVLLLRYGDSGWISRALSWQPLQWVGTISFSLYLWHWPLIVAWKYAKLGQIGPWDELGMVILSFLLAYPAWRFVERINMPQPAGFIKRIACLLPLFVLPIFGIGMAAFYLHIREEAGAAIRTPKTLSFIPQDESLSVHFNKVLFEYYPTFIGKTQKNAPSFLLMGDSHAGHLVTGLEHYCNELNIKGIYLNNSVTPYWWCYNAPNSFGDAAWNEQRAEAILTYLKARPDIKHVFIAQSWIARLYGASDTKDWRTMEMMDAAEQMNLREAGLRETCRRMKEMGVRVVLLADTPIWPSNPAPQSRWFRMKKIYNRTPPECTISRETHRQKAARYAEFFQRIQAEGLAWGIIDCAEPFRQGDLYRIQKGDDFFFRDSNHLSPSGSLLVGNYIMAEWHRLIQQAKSATESVATPDAAQ